MPPRRQRRRRRSREGNGSDSDEDYDEEEVVLASVDLGEPQHGSIETVALLTPLNGWSKTFIIRLLRIYYNNRS